MSRIDTIIFQQSERKQTKISFSNSFNLFIALYIERSRTEFTELSKAEESEKNRTFPVYEGKDA